MERISIQRALPALCLLFLVDAAHGEEAADTLDLHFREVLYHAHQERYFDALERLDTELGQHYGLDEPERDTLHAVIDEAEFSVGDFELGYRMHLRAGRAMRALLATDVDEATRNDAAYRLARLHFQKGQPDDALDALGQVEGETPESLREELDFLRANVLMALGEPGDAVRALELLGGSDSLTGFVEYNLGVAHLGDERPEEALRWLDRAGRVDAADHETQAHRGGLAPSGPCLT